MNPELFTTSMAGMGFWLMLFTFLVFGVSIFVISPYALMLGAKISKFKKLSYLESFKITLFSMLATIASLIVLKIIGVQYQILNFIYFLFLYLFIKKHKPSISQFASMSGILILAGIAFGIIISIVSYFMMQDIKQNMPDVSGLEELEVMTEEDLKNFQKDLESMNPEQLEELTKKFNDLIPEEN